jgi:hypothetical protein
MDDPPTLSPASAARLHYETSAGNLSSLDTYKQFIELMRLCEEDARTLSNLCKARSDLQMAKGWTAFANNFNRICDVVTELATGRARTSVGYYGNG